MTKNTAQSVRVDVNFRSGFRFLAQLPKMKYFIKNVKLIPYSFTSKSAV